MKNYLGLSIHPWWINGELNKLRQELDSIRTAGADYCELVIHALDVVAGGHLVSSRVDAVHKLMREYEFAYTLHLPYELNLLCPNTAHLYEKIFRASIDFAKEVDIGLIVYHAGITAKKDTLLQEVKIIQDLAIQAGDIKICMENGPFYRAGDYSAGITADTMLDFCGKVNLPNFLLTYDIGHGFLQLGGDAQELLRDLRKLLPCIGHIHLHDNFGISLPMAQYDYNHRIACGAADIHLPLGWGSIPIPEVLNILTAYNGIINLEIEKRFADQYASSLEIVRTYG
jgi:sugar phosphate isomerase/epimerase